MKGRIALTFWLVVVLAVATATASYAWLAINLSADVRGIELEVELDSIFLEISADSEIGYDKNVSFDRVMYALRGGDSSDEKGLSLVTCGRVQASGAVRLVATVISAENAHFYGGATYNGTGKYFKLVASDITGNDASYIDITSTLKNGDSVIGFYSVREITQHTVSETSDYFYYYRNIGADGVIDYVCLGKIPIGEPLANRLFWGYAYADKHNEVQADNTLNIVSLDLPPEQYALKNTVFLRCAEGTTDAKNLVISSIDVLGLHNYLTDAIRIMFVAESDDGESKTIFYNHREPESFNGHLFSLLGGDKTEIVKVDIYIYLDGTDQSAYEQHGVLTRNDVSVTFTVDDHDYN